MGGVESDRPHAILAALEDDPAELGEGTGGVDIDPQQPSGRRGGAEVGEPVSRIERGRVQVVVGARRLDIAKRRMVARSNRTTAGGEPVPT